LYIVLRRFVPERPTIAIVRDCGCQSRSQRGRTVEIHGLQIWRIKLLNGQLKLVAWFGEIEHRISRHDLGGGRLRVVGLDLRRGHDG
jgi:hypothetical protein